MNVVYHLKSSDRLKQEIKYIRIIDFIRILYTVGYEYPQYMKFEGKIIVVFDDNISSGATLDMLCNELKKYNPKMIIPITLGQIPITSYSKSERIGTEKRA